MMRPIAVLSLLSLASLSAANAAPPASSPAMPNAALRKEQATQTYSEHGAAKSSDLERSFTLGGNVLFPIPIGNSNLVFKDGIGGEAHAWLNNILNQPGLALHASVGYQSFNIVNLSKFTLTQLTFLAGLEIMAPQDSFFLRPFISGELGTAYDRLNTAGSDVTQNANFAFVAQARGGIAIQLFHRVSLDVAMPFTAYFSQNQLYVISGVAGLRVEL